MYSVVLMAALSANGPDAVSFGHHRGGCGGCYGGGWSCGGCGGCWGGCSGWGCGGGCWGGGCWGGGGGCWGVGHGCYGGGWSGWRHSHMCCGCYGGTACYGGCYGSCMGCYGGCYGQPVWSGAPAMPYHDSGNPITPQAQPARPGEMVPAPTTPANPPAARPGGGTAKLILDLPAGANLFVDDIAISGKDTTRQFATPHLEPGQTYYYNVRVESNRDGKPVSETRRVLVRGGELIRESFGETRADVVRASR